jgi:carboxypeptidase PM20D1
VISEAIGAIYPEALVTPSLLTATTDTRHYVDLADDLYRFHGMMMDASQIGSIHGTNEYIGVESYENTIAVAREMMRLGSR